jgi:hypothetical protein
MKKRLTAEEKEQTFNHEVIGEQFEASKEVIPFHPFRPYEENLKGKILVMKPKMVAEGYRKRNWLLYRAIDGFGCDPNLRGSSIVAENIEDGEIANWDRNDFYGIFIGTLPEKRQFTVKVARTTIQTKDVVIEAKNRGEAERLAREQHQHPLGWGEPKISYSAATIGEYKPA